MKNLIFVLAFTSISLGAKAEVTKFFCDQLGRERVPYLSIVEVNKTVKGSKVSETAYAVSIAYPAPSGTRNQILKLVDSDGHTKIYESADYSVSMGMSVRISRKVNPGVSAACHAIMRTGKDRL